MKTITFSYNWNNKLGCKAFTTIRLYNPNKYKIGETYKINLKKECIGAGKIIAIKNFMLKELNEFIAHIDTGYSKEECEKIIRRMYETKVNLSTVLFSLILIQKVSSLMD